MRRFIAGLLILGSVPLAASEAKPRLLGIRIIAPGVQAGGSELKAFNGNAGTTLSFYLPAPAGSIIAIDDDASGIESASDDTGRDLTPDVKDANGFRHRADIGSFPSIAADGSGALVEIGLPQVPAPDATHIILRAKIVLVTASQREQVISEASDFAVGAALQVGPLDFRVTENGEPQWGDAVQQIEFKTSDPIEDIASVGISLADGRTLPLKRRGSSSISGLGMRSYTVSYDVPELVAEGRLVIERWTDRQERTVTIDRKLTVGLGTGG